MTYEQRIELETLRRDVNFYTTFVLGFFFMIMGLSVMQYFVTEPVMSMVLRVICALLLLGEMTALFYEVKAARKWRDLRNVISQHD